MRYKYSDKDLSDAVANSTSVRQVLSKLKLKEAGGNYFTVKQRIKKLNLNCSHFTGHLNNKGKVLGHKRPLEDYLTNKHTIQSHKLRLRLISEGYFEHKCYRCFNSEWNNLPIPLELEHKDGNHSNNNLNNLTILCPNCHAQTSTYRGRNISK